MSMGRVGGARCLSRDQSRHGMAVRRRTWHAARKRSRRVAGVATHRTGSRDGRRTGPAWRRTSGPHRPTRDDESRRRGNADDARALPAVASSASALRRHAGDLWHADRLVVSDGICPRGGIHGAPVRDAEPDAVSAATGEHAGHLAAAGSVPWAHAAAVGVHTLAYLLVMTLVRVDRLSQAGTEAASYGVVQPGLAVGRRAGGDWRSRAPDVTKPRIAE